MTRAFRFGVVAAVARSGDEWREKARRVEGLGFATLVVPDGLQYTLSPFPALAATAAATTTLRVGTYVAANDYRHPVMLAKEAATLDLLSGGRLELGIGAGRPSAEADYRMLGQPFEAGAIRVERLAEALAILKPLLAGESVTFAGAHYRVQDASVRPLSIQQPPPILLGASQRRLLTLAGREADIAALGVEPAATEGELAQRIEWIRQGAGDRFGEVELNLNLMAVAGQVPSYLRQTMGVAAADLASSEAIPVLKGTLDQMCDRLQWLRERFGISYVLVSDELMDALAPVVGKLAGF